METTIHLAASGKKPTTPAARTRKRRDASRRGGIDTGS